MFARLFKSKKKQEIKPLFKEREDDIYLVSFPKSGNTWLRFLLGNYLTKGKMDFYNAHLFMPDIHYNPADIDKITDSPRFIKSHFPYRKEYKKVIYLVRDGRETAVSYYYFLIKMKGIAPETTFSDYLENHFFAGKPPYGHWNEHVFSWVKKNHVPELLLVRYEDLLANTEKEFKRILNFANIKIDQDVFEKAIEASSFRSMKKDEESKPDFIEKLGMNSLKTQYGFVREGKTDSWKTILTTAEAEKFWTKYGDALEFLGYEK